MDIHILETFTYGILFTLVGLGIWLSHHNDDVFRQYVREDGLIESATALLLFFVAVINLYRLTNSGFSRSLLFRLVTGAVALLFLFGAGEEISWGQRIFGWETPEAFANNVQNETNLHNLAVGGVKINKLIFGKALTVALFVYFLFLPLVSLVWPKIFDLYNRFFLPIPSWHHTAVFLICAGGILLVESGKRGELNEIVLACILLLTFVWPYNIKHLRADQSHGSG